MKAKKKNRPKQDPETLAVSITRMRGYYRVHTQRGDLYTMCNCETLIEAVEEVTQHFER